MPQQEINQTLFIDLAKLSANSNTLLTVKSQIPLALLQKIQLKSGCDDSAFSWY